MEREETKPYFVRFIKRKYLYELCFQNEQFSKLQNLMETGLLLRLISSLDWCIANKVNLNQN